jgi:hypothetical protein
MSPWGVGCMAAVLLLLLQLVGVSYHMLQSLCDTEQPLLLQNEGSCSVTKRTVTGVSMA